MDTRSNKTRELVPIVVFLTLLMPLTAGAYTVSQTTCNPSGNPPGQLCTVVTDLEEGDSFNLLWLLPAGTENTDQQSLPVDLSAAGTVSVDLIADGYITLGVSLTNTTDPTASDPDYTGRLDLTAFGITTGDNIVTSASTSGADNFIYADTSNFPAFATDACVFGGSTCAGAGTSGLGAGVTDTFTATLVGNFVEGQLLDLDTFATKWQTDDGSYELSPVPIPAAAWLFGSALLGVAGIGYRRNRTA